MKKSDLVMLTVVGTAYGYSLFHHDTIYRDQYASREACLQDWGNSTSDCEEERSSGGHGTGRYYGPSYEDGSRPQTRNPSLRESTPIVKRGGFGRSGARFTVSG